MHKFGTLLWNCLKFPFMHTWNTTTKTVSTNKLAHAVDKLQALECPEKGAILKRLQKSGPLSLLELALQGHLELAELQAHLDALCELQFVTRQPDIIGCQYSLKTAQLAKAQRIARSLSAFFQE